MVRRLLALTLFAIIASTQPGAAQPSQVAASAASALRDADAAVLHALRRSTRERAGVEAADAVHANPARSASDDKSPIVALATALDALAAQQLAPTSNVRVILDGEEEAGSPSLVPAIAKYRELLTADAMLILDGPVHPSDKPTLVFGARGIVTLELTVFGPKVALHSGHYGNWAPNSAMRLAQLLATCKDDEGNVRLRGAMTA